MQHPIANLTLLSLLAVAAACHGSTAATNGIEIREPDIEICCDPSQGAPGKVGEIDVFLNEDYFGFLDPASITTEITYTGTVGTPARLDVPSTASLPMGHTTISVFLDDCDFTEIEIEMDVHVTGVRNDSRQPFSSSVVRSFVIRNTCPPQTPIPPQQIAEAIVGTPIANFAQYLIATPTGVPMPNSNPSIPPRIPEAKTETFQVGAIVVDLDQSKIENAFTGINATFPVGKGPNGFTLEPAIPQPMVPGRYLLTWQCTDADIPINDPVKWLQYSFVADSDLSPANNFVAQAPYTGDYWTNTDTQYSAEYTPAGGWIFHHLRTQTTPLQPAPSGARCILFGQVNFFIVPWDEVGSTLAMDGRYSTFCHEGDYGQFGGPWSGDQTPPVAEPMLRFDWQLSF